MATHNYKPKTMTIASAAATSGVAMTNSISTLAWGMFLLKGTAIDPVGGAMDSGAVQVWLTASPTTGPATHTTFTDADGRYGVTVEAGRGLWIKFLGA